MSWKKELVIKNLAWINKLIFKLYFMALSFTTRCQLSTLVCILIMNVLISIGLRVTRSSSICWPPWSSSTTHLSTTGSLATLSTCLHPDASLLSRPLQVQAETLNRYSMRCLYYMTQWSYVEIMIKLWNSVRCRLAECWVVSSLEYVLQPVKRIFISICEQNAFYRRMTVSSDSLLNESSWRLRDNSSTGSVFHLFSVASLANTTKGL